MITISNVTKFYGNFCAVNNLNLTINQSEVLGLLGPNGAGKTTTLRIITGFLQPDQGKVIIKDLKLPDQATAAKKIIGYLPESAPLYKNMLVFDYLHYAAQIRKIPPGQQLARITSVADICSLNNIMHKPIGTLSKGLKQRVGLAYVLLHDPEILILDEPTSGLDPNQILEIRSLIKEIGKQKTVILSTHILSEAESTCDRMVIINQGKIVADGTPEELKNPGAGHREIKLELTGPSLDEAKECLEQIPGLQVTSWEILESNNRLRLTIHSQEGTDLRAAIFQSIKKTSWTLLEMYQHTQDLEHIFRQLTVNTTLN